MYVCMYAFLLVRSSIRTLKRLDLCTALSDQRETWSVYPIHTQIHIHKYMHTMFQVLFLKDGAKVELRFVPNFEEIYKYGDNTYLLTYHTYIHTYLHTYIHTCKDYCKEYILKV